MTYKVDFTDQSKTGITVSNLSVETSTNVGFVGQGYKNYSEVVAENFLHMLENFANGSAPAKPVEGQIWYDNNTNRLKYFDDTESNSGNWKPIASMTVQDTEPTAVGESDGHFWLDSNTGILYLYFSGSWIAFSDVAGDTQVVTRTRYDLNDVPHRTVEVIVNGVIVSITSSDPIPWQPQIAGDNIEYLEDGVTLLNTQFPEIVQGINLNTLEGYTFNGPLNATLEGIGNTSTIHLTTGTGNAYAVTSTNPLTEYLAGQEILVRFHAAPTGSSTFNQDGLGVKNIKKFNGAGSLVNIAANDWDVDRIMRLSYDGTQFILQGVLGATTSRYGLVKRSTSAQNVTGTATDVYPTVAGVVEIIDTQLNAGNPGAPTYSARAWVNFEGGGVVAIRGAGNVSSVTDLGVGKYRITFTEPMSSVNYASTTQGQRNGLPSYGDLGGIFEQTTTYLTVQFRRSTNYDSFDIENGSVVVFQ